MKLSSDFCIFLFVKEDHQGSGCALKSSAPTIFSPLCTFWSVRSRASNNSSLRLHYLSIEMCVLTTLVGRRHQCRPTNLYVMDVYDYVTVTIMIE